MFVFCTRPRRIGRPRPRSTRPSSVAVVARASVLRARPRPRSEGFNDPCAPLSVLIEIAISRLTIVSAFQKSTTRAFRDLTASASADRSIFAYKAIDAELACRSAFVFFFARLVVFIQNRHIDIIAVAIAIATFTTSLSLAIFSCAAPPLRIPAGGASFSRRPDAQLNRDDGSLSPAGCRPARWRARAGRPRRCASWTPGWRRPPGRSRRR